jgi:hypothetical protein
MSAQLICHPLSKHRYVPSEVIKEMNSETHSCMHSFASLAILAFSGKADFMILATGAKFCMLASVCKCALSALLKALDDERCAGGDEDDCGEDEGIAIRASHHPVARVEGCRWLAFRGASDSTKTGKDQMRVLQALYVGGESPSATRSQQRAIAGVKGKIGCTRRPNRQGRTRE